MSGSKFAMLFILEPIAAIVFYTFLISFIFSILDMCKNIFGRCCVYSCTLNLYCAIASFTFASTFFNTVLSRTPKLPADQYEEALAAARAQGYDLTPLRVTPQSAP